MTVRFRYGADPLCWGSWVAYGVIRFVLKPVAAAVWVRSWAVDFFLIPAGLPLYLWVERRLGLRRHDGPPQWIEAGSALVVWSVLAEWIGPRLFPRATGDGWDVVAYGLGMLAAMAVWKGRAAACSPPRRMNFDFIAGVYDFIEWLGGSATHRARIAYMDRLAPDARVLTVGEGTGRWLVEWLRRAPGARVVCVEASAAMAQRGRQRLAKAGVDASGVEWVIADVRQWSPGGGEGRFDVIVTHFFLDCFTPEGVRDVVHRLAAMARPRAVWLLADFQIPAAAGWPRLRARLILPLLYRFFRTVAALEARRLPEPAPILASAGFLLTESRLFDAEFIRSDFHERSGETLESTAADGVRGV